MRKAFLIFLVVSIFLLAGFGWMFGLFPPAKGIAEMAAKINVPSLCMIVPPRGWDTKPRINCLGIVANRTNNTKACDLMDSIGRIRNCYARIGVRTKDFGVCNTLNDKKDCYLQSFIFLSGNIVALSEQGMPQVQSKTDLDCTNILESDEKLTCRAFTAEETDSIVCEQVSDPRLLVYCLDAIARNDGNITVCKKINNVNAMNHCIINIARGKKDVQLCAELTDDASKDYCTYRIAVETHNISLCPFIKNPDLQNRCNEYAR